MMILIILKEIYKNESNKSRQQEQQSYFEYRSLFDLFIEKK
jgi:hypothetical protein